MSKGFYFSFDALMALTLMAGALVLTAQSSDIATDPFQANTITYERSQTLSQDAMKLASIQTFRVFNDSFQQDLVDDTVMDEEDLNRTIIDGIGLLWAARNISDARKVSKQYFESKLPDEYGFRIQVNETSGGTIIYKTGQVPEDAESVSAISRLLSGHQIDKPSEGFQARARATEVTKNQTEAFAISSQGGAKFGGRLYIERTFDVPGTKVWNATLFLTPHYGCSNNNFEQIRINGQLFTNPDINWIAEERDCPKSGYDTGTGALGYIDVTELVEKGENQISIRFRNNDYNAHLHPGMRMRVKYTSNQTSVSDVKHERVYFDNTRADEHSDDKTGLFAVKAYEIPHGATIKNVTFHLNASGVDRKYEGEQYDEQGSSYYEGYCEWSKDGGWYYVGNVWDVRVLHNQQVIDSSFAPADGVVSRDYDLTDDTVNGTNLVSVYLNWEGDCAWGEDDTELHSDFESNLSTHIDIWYEEPPGGLEFGRIDVTQSEFFGVSGNPVTYSKEFDYDDLKSTHVLPTQLTGSLVEVNVWPSGDSKQTVFTSPGSRSVPSSLYVDDSYYDTDRTNNVELRDSNSGNIFLSKSAFQYTLSVPSQVGYGELFPNQTAAINDAHERLEDVLGDFVNAENIETDGISTGDQPYIWGPANVKLVVWR